MYSSLFKKDDVRITQAFHSGHKALDLSRGVVRQPIYSGAKLGTGVVSYTATSYVSSGKTWSNSWVVYIKYDNGMTARMFHGQVNDAVVKTGDRVTPGLQVYRTGSTGNSTADHLHYVLLDKSGVAIDPTPWVINDNVANFKKGDTVKFTGVQNIRSGSGTTYPVSGSSTVGETASIIDGPRVADGYTWFDMRFEKGGTGWVAVVGKFELYVPQAPVEPTTPVEPPEESECEKRVKILEGENAGLKIELGASQGRESLLNDRVEFLEGTMVIREKEYKDLESDFTRVKDERDRFEGEKLELQRKLDELEQGRDTWIRRIADILHNLFSGK